MNPGGLEGLGERVGRVHGNGSAQAARFVHLEPAGARLAQPQPGRLPLQRREQRVQALALRRARLFLAGRAEGNGLGWRRVSMAPH